MEHPWNYKGRVLSGKYVRIYVPEHSRAHKDGYVYEHILVMESIINEPLPEGAEVHHKNGNKQDNSPDNLLLCSSSAAHNKEHQKDRAFAVCGNREFRKCWVCGCYDDPINMWTTSKKAYHPCCINKYKREKYKNGTTRNNIRRMA